MLQLVKFMSDFKNNGYPDNFINNYFKTCLDNKHRIQEKVTALSMKPLFLVLAYLGQLSLQTRAKLRTLSKVYSFSANYRLCLTVKTNYQMLFALKITFQRTYIR